jgi:cation-transporting ATPase E
VPADGTLIRGELSLNESLLTGEADEVHKGPGSNVMSGSFVVSGRAFVRLDRVGSESYISKLMLQAKTMDSGEVSEMVRSINFFVKLAGVAIIPVGIALFVQGFFINKSGFQPSITSMVGALIGMIPEGLYFLVSLTLAAGAARLAGRQVLLHDMKSIEQLARVDVFCVDKTGTITENEMRVADILLASQTESVPSGTALSQTDPEVAEEDNLRWAAQEQERLLLRGILKDYVDALPDNNATMQALREHLDPVREKEPYVSRTLRGKESKEDQEKKKERRGLMTMMPFSSAKKYSSVTFTDGTYALGAPDVLLGEKMEAYEALLKEPEERGMRVIAFGRMTQGTFEPVCFPVLENPIRKNAKDTFGYFAKQGVVVKVISGDNPVTVSSIAARAGIGGAERYVDARTLQTEMDYAEAVRRYTVFGRVTPDQKRHLVHALQMQGHTVAMTGDGVNDILAMKDADCSIAMASGADAAVQAAQVALLDSDFSHMPQIVGEGRRIINNITRSATLFLVKNIFSLSLAIFAIVSSIVYPILPAQMSLISGFGIGLPAFFLAMEPNDKMVRGNFLRTVLQKAIPAALTEILSIGALILFGRVFSIDSAEVSVAATLLLAVISMMILARISAPLNKYRGIVLGVNFVLCMISAIGLDWWFAISAIRKEAILLLVLFTIASEPVYRYLNLFTGLIVRLVERRQHGKRKKVSD